MPQPKQPLILTALVDLLALIGAFLLGFQLHFVDAVLLLSAGPADFHRYLFAMLVLVPFWLLVFAFCGMYGQELVLHGTGLVQRTTETAAVAAFSSLGGVYLAGDPRLSRGWFVTTALLSLLFVVTGRQLVLTWLRGQRRRRPWRILLIGASQGGEGAARALTRRPDLQVAGFLDDYLPLGLCVGGVYRVLGRPADVRRVAAEERADELLAVEGTLSQESYDHLLREVYLTPDMPPLRLIPSVVGELVTHLHPAYRGTVPILIPELSRITGLTRIAKGLLDRSLAVLALAMASPVLLVLWLGAHRRGLPLLRETAMIGSRGYQFKRLSLQLWWRPGEFADSTMRLSSFPEHSHFSYLLTKLPRLLNVLRGELSIIGPRPITAEDLTLYSEWAGVLLAMKPGLLGPWLLHSKSTLTPQEELQADLAYVRHYTLLRDLTILARTARQLAGLLYRRAAVAAASDGAQGEALWPPR
ncbi:MAG: sugar transferase [Chloroflexi bacterium]|nr:sugar transferase [Chloroflexota bacterium]